VLGCAIVYIILIIEHNGEVSSENSWICVAWLKKILKHFKIFDLHAAFRTKHLQN